MLSEFIETLSASPLVRALSWTLLHSLWQGLLLSIVTTVLLMFSRKWTAARRYSCIAALMVLFIAVNGISFGIEYFREISIHPGPETTALVSGSRSVTGESAGVAVLRDSTGSAAWLQLFIQYCNDHAGMLVLIWLILAMARFLRLTGGILYVHRLRHYKTYEVPLAWSDKLQELARRIGVRHQVQVLESALARVPLVIGHFKPLILVPLGILSNLPASQVEAVLLHELEHIRRNDYLVNLLQNLVESVYFFNPALLWLSRLMRAEREHCCDDAAVAQGEGKELFVSALVSFQEYRIWRMSARGFPALASGRQQLFSRVRRLLYNENKKINAMEKSIFVLSIGAISLLGFASINQQSPEKISPALPAQKQVLPKATEEVTRTGAAFRDTVPKPSAAKKEPEDFKSLNIWSDRNDGKGTSTITAIDRDDTRYKLIRENGKLIALYKNDEQIPENKYSDYQTLIDRMDAAAKKRQAKYHQLFKEDSALKMKMQKEMLVLQKQKLVNRAERQKSLQLLQEQKAKLDRELALREKNGEARLLEEKFNNQLRQEKLALANLERKQQLFKQDESANFQLQLAQKQWKEQQLKLFLEQEAAQNRDQRKALREFQRQQNRLLHSENDGLNEEMNLKLMNEKLRQEKLNQEQLQRKESRQNRKASQDRRIQLFIQPIIRDLLAQHIIDNQDELSFQLDNRKLLVNGRKQPAGIHEQFRKKYLGDPGDSISYTKKKNSRNININIH